MTRGPQVGQTVGVLALQGAFAAHQLAFESLGQKTLQVRNEEDLASVDALVFPGGESTAMSHLLRTSRSIHDFLRACLHSARVPE